MFISTTPAISRRLFRESVTTTAKALRLRRFSALAWDVLVFADATTDDDSAWLGAAPGPGALFHHI